MMNGMEVAYRCPRCEQTTRAPLPSEVKQITCELCDAVITISEDAIEAGSPGYCIVCRSTDLFTRKDFPQRVGITIVVIGFIASAIAWYSYQIFLAFGILFITSAIDVLLYLLVADALVCYRCGAHYRGASDMEAHGAFDLETHERYRQMAARQSQQSGPSDPVTSEGDRVAESSDSTQNG